jgi:ELWxxDGT repeat protein
MRIGRTALAIGLVLLAEAAQAAPPTAELVKDINPSGYSDPGRLTALGGIGYFAADDGVHGRELWRTDGTAVGTVLVKDIRPGPAGSDPDRFVVVGGLLFFVADDGTTGVELWRSDGTAAGTALVKDILPGPAGSSPEEPVPVDGLLFFDADDGVHGREPWKSDGTAAGTVLVKDIRLGALTSDPNNLTVMNGFVYFRADDGVTGEELWRSDGTAAGTTLVKDINPDPPGGSPGFLVAGSGTLFFAAEDPVHGREVWKSDGTAAGTVLVADIVPGAASGFTGGFMLVVGGTVFFPANDGVHGPELWKSDGTAAGTLMLKDINPGVPGSAINVLGALNGTLFFRADDGLHGTEMWKTDGSPAGTVLLEDINPGPAESNPILFRVVGGVGYFRATDGATGIELWRTDGTAAGTVRVTDLNPGPGDSDPSLSVVNGTLFLQASIDSSGGKELYALFPNDRLVTGAGPGAGAHARQLDARTGVETLGLIALPVGFTGGVRVATGDVNGDLTPDLIVAPGPGGGPNVRVLDGETGAVLHDFFAYLPGFTGGVSVAAGDVNGDGKADIVTGAGIGGGPHVRVFDGGTGAELLGFFAFDPGLRDGVLVAAGDVTGDGRADIITGAGPGGGPHVKVFDGGTGAEVRSFFAYDPGLRAGVFVAAGDVDGDAVADIITGSGPGGGPHVKVFDGTTLGEVQSFLPYDPGARGGVLVGAVYANRDGRADVVTGAGPGAGPHVRVFDGGTLAELQSFFAYDPAFTGGVFVGGSPR